MNKNEWITIKTLLSMEIDKLQKSFGLPLEALNRGYFEWIEKVERHIHIHDVRAEITPQEAEIMNGFAEAQDMPPLSPHEIEILVNMYKTIRRVHS